MIAVYANVSIAKQSANINVISLQCKIYNRIEYNVKYKYTTVIFYQISLNQQYSPILLSFYFQFFCL